MEQDGPAAELAAAAAAVGDQTQEKSNRDEDKSPANQREELESLEKEIDRREATAAPLLKAPPPSPEVDATMPPQGKHPPHHRHLQSGSAKSMTRQGTLERSLSSTIGALPPPDPKRSRGDEVEETEAAGAGGWKRRWCKCMVAFAGDCAALCCCPCTILHLVALVCIRLPLTLLYGACSRLRQRWRRHWRHWRRWWRSWLRRQQSKSRMSVASSFSADIGEAVVAVAAAAAARLGAGGHHQPQQQQQQQHQSSSSSSFNAWPFGEPLAIDFPPYPGGFGDARHWSFFDSASEGSGGSPKKSHSLSSAANAQPWEQQQQQQQHRQQLQEQQND